MKIATIHSEIRPQHLNPLFYISPQAERLPIEGNLVAFDDDSRLRSAFDFTRRISGLAQAGGELAPLTAREVAAIQWQEQGRMMACVMARISSPGSLRQTVLRSSA
ncbi:hypothetical protein [Pseudoxanthomonas mexicana]|uniref:hypothetical protein n=1 Tax=Pseudoxanthomonas mexicana TaxID=128785 RepID=UPI00398A9409